MRSAHGYFDVNWFKSTMHIEMVGSFNREGMIDYINEAKSQVLNHCTSFSIIIDGSKFEGATLDSFNELEQYNAWLNKLNQLQYKAIVQNCQIQRQIANKFLPAINAQKIAYFSQKEEALRWLEKVT